MNHSVVAWEPSGRPRLVDPTAPQAELSIAHDGGIGLAVVGCGPQGCDVQAVDPRTRSDWLALLGTERASCLDMLIAGGDTLDQAGTRLWATVESSIKALGAPAPQQFRVVGRAGSAVLLEVDHVEHGPWSVFTSLVSLEAGHDHVIAMGLETEPRTLPELIDEPAVQAVPDLPDIGSEPIRWDPDGSASAYTQTFTVLVRDVPKALGSAHFSSFVSWMGDSRETAMRETAPLLERDLREGRGKLVSSSLSLRCTAPVKAGDRVTAVLTTSSPDWEHGPYTYHWVFRLGDVDGPVVGAGSMQAVWIAPATPTTWAIAAPPRYLGAFLSSLAAAVPADVPAEPTGLLGDLLARGDGGHTRAVVECDFTVALDETDFQGHAHFVNYFRWQAVARDALLRSIGIPIVEGTLVPACLTSEMSFLREILPFERIRVTAEVEAVYAGGLDVRLSYLKLAETGEVSDKVAGGWHRLALVEVGQDGELLARPLPVPALEALGLALTPQLAS